MEKRQIITFNEGFYPLFVGVANPWNTHTHFWTRSMIAVPVWYSLVGMVMCFLSPREPSGTLQRESTIDWLSFRRSLCSWCICVLRSLMYRSLSVYWRINAFTCLRVCEPAEISDSSCRFRYLPSLPQSHLPPLSLSSSSCLPPCSLCVRIQLSNLHAKRRIGCLCDRGPRREPRWETRMGRRAEQRGRDGWKEC